MAIAGDKAERQLREITECSICTNSFTDPRILPCIHTFCLECLKRTGEAERKKAGDKMPCPLCRKEFTIPSEGIVGVQRNFFMENFLEYQKMLQNNQSSSKTETKTELELKHSISLKTCTKHSQKVLELYCAKCKKIICVSCFVESHKHHDCKDVTTYYKEFRKTIERKGKNISNYAGEMTSIKSKKLKRKADFLKEIDKKEKEIRRRSQELKDITDRHTKSLLEELSRIKSKYLKIMDTKMEEIDRYFAILKSFESYCTNLRSKGSASDICSSVDQLTVKAEELRRDHEEFIGRPQQSFEISFQATDLRHFLHNASSNLIGKFGVKMETSAQFETFAVAVGLHDGSIPIKDVVRVNLERPSEVSAQEEVPTRMSFGAVAAVYDNTIYVTGIGENSDEIWKYNTTSRWTKCASLVQGRIRHSAAFIDEELYMCGGYLESSRPRSITDSVEAYNAITDKCVLAGKLVHCICDSGNCVPYKSSLYIFGGIDKSHAEFSHIQVYNTEDNSCTVLSNPMPRQFCLMRALSWETSVVLVGRDACLIYNIETETWKSRERMKTDTHQFGLVLDNKRVFVFGAGVEGKDVRVIPLRKILDDKPIDWKIHATFQQKYSAYSCVKMGVLV